MCGIAGLLHHAKTGPVDRGLLARMNGALEHRGPDDGGLWTSADGRAGLAMRRLSIIDLAWGRQPMANGDGSLQIVFNGEIYNFQALRAELEAKGRVFRTRSDTEVILHLYEEEGVECVRRLRGMFAFALWDAPRGRLFLGRDRFGKKPLFYTDAGGRLAWASELQALKALPDFPREMDPAALDLYLSLQYIPSPRTIYKGVFKLPPAHRLVWEKGAMRVERWWDLPVEAPPLRIGLEEAREEIRRRLTEAVRLRMVADVPLGAFLSGGVDSSVVVGLMSRLSSRPVKTFSIGFEEDAFSEVAYARAAAERFGTDHAEFIVKPDAAEVLPLLARHYGEPFADPSALPTYLVSRETRRHVTVALNGDGGDENFAGYLRYQAARLAALLDRAPAGALRALRAGAGVLPDGLGSKGLAWRLKRFLDGALERDPAARHLAFSRFFTQGEKDALYAPAFAASVPPDGALKYFRPVFARAAGLDPVNRSLYADFSTYLPEGLMTKVDVATMAASLEGRSPLLDHELAEFVFRLPGDWKLKGFTGLKWIFKETFRDLLPPPVSARGKMGFGIPLGPWFRQGPLRALFEETALSPQALSRGLFREDAVRALFQEHLSTRRDHGYKLWSLLMLELWHRHA
jgi:asparagine synthase (glutamine-hydrolysing)